VCACVHMHVHVLSGEATLKYQYGRLRWCGTEYSKWNVRRRSVEIRGEVVEPSNYVTACQMMKHESSEEVVITVTSMEPLL